MGRWIKWQFWLAVYVLASLRMLARPENADIAGLDRIGEKTKRYSRKKASQ